MSQLILNFFKNPGTFGLELKPVGHCNYEDHIEMKGKKAREMLQLSYSRKKDLPLYVKKLKQILRNVNSINKIENTAPMSFCWSIDKNQFLSTSLFFEYYMATLCNALQQLQQAMKQEKGNKQLYKDSKTGLIHLLGMFDEWKTQLLILPRVPYVVTPMFIKSMLCLAHGCHTLHISHTLSGKSATVGFHTAMQSFGEVWPRYPYGVVAFHQYLVSRVLLYNSLSETQECPNKKITCLKEIESLLPYIKFQECYLNQEVLEMMKTIEKENASKIDSLENTHYAVPETLNDISLPQGYKLIICDKTGQFGCKCKE